MPGDLESAGFSSCATVGSDAELCCTVDVLLNGISVGYGSVLGGAFVYTFGTVSNRKEQKERKRKVEEAGEAEECRAKSKYLQERSPSRHSRGVFLDTSHRQTHHPARSVQCGRLDEGSIHPQFEHRSHLKKKAKSQAVSIVSSGGRAISLPGISGRKSRGMYVNA